MWFLKLKKYSDWVQTFNNGFAGQTIFAKNVVKLMGNISIAVRGDRPSIWFKMSKIRANNFSIWAHQWRKTVSISVKIVFFFWEHLDFDRETDWFFVQNSMHQVIFRAKVWYPPQMILSSYAQEH